MASDLYCEECGSDRIEHVRRRDATGAILWRNRCRTCGDEGDYIPNRAEIAAACLKIRQQQGWTPVEDDEERRYRQWEAEQARAAMPVDDDEPDPPEPPFLLQPPRPAAARGAFDAPPAPRRSA